MISETKFTTSQVIRDLRTLLSGIDRSESETADYLYLSLRNILFWLPENINHNDKYHA